MKWPWSKREPAPEIPPYRPPNIELKPLEPKDPAYVVEEKEMSETGMWRIFPWTKKEPKE